MALFAMLFLETTLFVVLFQSKLHCLLCCFSQNCIVCCVVSVENSIVGCVIVENGIVCYVVS